MMKFNTLVITAATVAAAALLSPSASYYASAQAGTTVSGPCPEVADALNDTCGAIKSDATFPSCCNAAKEYCRCYKDGTLKCGPDPSPTQTCSLAMNNILKDTGDEDSLDDVDVGGVVDGAENGSGGSGGGGNAAKATIALSIVAAVSVIGVTTVDLI